MNTALRLKTYKNRAVCPRPQHSALLSFPGGPAEKRQSCCRHLRCHAVGAIVSTEWDDDDYIEVGTLGRAHGIKGEVIVGLSTSSPDERFGQPGKRLAHLFLMLCCIVPTQIML